MAQPVGYTGSPGVLDDESRGAHRQGSDAAVVRVARQPILDGEAHLIGYELLFRAPHAEAAAAEFPAVGEPAAEPPPAEAFARTAKELLPGRVVKMMVMTMHEFLSV